MNISKIHNFFYFLSNIWHLTKCKIRGKENGGDLHSIHTVGLAHLLLEGIPMNKNCASVKSLQRLKLYSYQTVFITMHYYFLVQLIFFQSIHKVMVIYYSFA